MNVKLWLLTSSILIGFIFSAYSNRKTKELKEMNNLQMKRTDGANTYQQKFNQYNYYIESIGRVTIDNVQLHEGVLTAHYSYKLGGEIRNVVSSLTLKNDGIYKGTCTTKANGKTLFAVTTWLTFSEDGTALGNWTWSGNPSKNNPVVKISKK